ncbi:MAG: hypothetical protein K0U20_08950 [Proteobacteria bacterium]|nr:hypothetical protein [Pseudomonadota bacterium]
MQTTEPTIAVAATNGSVELINAITTLLINPENFIPLIFAFGAGWLYSLSPYIVNMKTLQAKKFNVYACNAVFAVSGYVALHYDAPIKPLLSSAMFIFGVSILLPAIYFRIFPKK